MSMMCAFYVLWYALHCNLLQAFLAALKILLGLILPGQGSMEW